MKLILFLISLFLIGSCSRVLHGSLYLSVLNEPITQTTLASVRVNAPDKLHALNPHGQRLYISWKIPKKYLTSRLKGLLKVRFKVPEQIEIPFEINYLKGTMTYQILNEDYFSKGGVLAYKVELFANGEKIDDLEHKMWADLITFP